MCNSDEVRQAFKNVGRPCTIDGGTYAGLEGFAKPTIEDSNRIQDELYRKSIEREEDDS